MQDIPRRRRLMGSAGIAAAACLSAATMGDDDQIVPFADSGLLQSKLIKGATLKVYKGAPHGLCTTLKEEVNQELLEFFKRAERAAA
jgi:fermentation-respiration switch protein FrsA (DUF1100 family)